MEIKMTKPITSQPSTLTKSQTIGTTISVQVPQLSIDSTLTKILEQGGSIAFILALAVLVGMLTRFVETVKKQ
jgi:hypothetical protein